MSYLGNWLRRISKTIDRSTVAIRRQSLYTCRVCDVSFFFSLFITLLLFFFFLLFVVFPFQSGRTTIDGNNINDNITVIAEKTGTRAPTASGEVDGRKNKTLAHHHHCVFAVFLCTRASRRKRTTTNTTTTETTTATPTTTATRKNRKRRRGREN